MRWLLDTNVVSEQIRRRPEPAVVEWLRGIPLAHVAVSAGTIAELRDGAASVADERRRTQLLAWINDDVAEFFGSRILAVDVEVLLDWIHLGRRLAARRRPHATPDTLIASTARVHRLILVSRNLQDFAGTGITVHNPWTGETSQMTDS